MSERGEAAAKFYRETLEQICQDRRNTRAKRLAESALMFWDQMHKETAKANALKKGNQ